MTKRVNTRLVKRAQQALGHESIVQSAAVSYAGIHPMTLLAAVLGGAVVIVLLFVVATGILFVPGAIPMFLVRYYLGKPRVVAGTDHGLALFKQSFWTGKPTEVLARIAFLPPGLSTQGSWTQVDFGPERVWLRPDRLALSGPPL